ncbi:hypothetical protein C0Q70_20844 [Pomacea canaliculata]|uniref:G-protein coupled receptors family 1 profile domain-containing protein n=1 Tax=Pomacea canaliculata TaxID=400727 RepID=A0A2T7NAV1_POMCA|nr:hypothetical protein C0Q70_20844 [Pomacea canaliculata]
MSFTEVMYLTSGLYNLRDFNLEPSITPRAGHVEGKEEVIAVRAFTPCRDPDNNIDEMTAKMVERVFHTSVLTSLQVFGVSTNVFNMAVFRRQGLRDRINLCLFSLALADFAFLIFIFAAKSYSFLGLFDQRLEDYWSQRYLNTVLGLTLGAQNVSNTITAIISLERCICVLSPFTAKKFLKTRYMAVLIAAMSVYVTSFYNLFNMKYVTVFITDPVTNQTHWASGLSSFYLSNRAVVDVLNNYLLGLTIPCTSLGVVMVTTCITVIKLRSTVAWRSRDGQRENYVQKRKKGVLRHKDVTCRLLCVPDLYLAVGSSGLPTNLHSRVPTCRTKGEMSFTEVMYLTSGLYNLKDFSLEPSITPRSGHMEEKEEVTAVGRFIPCRDPDNNIDEMTAKMVERAFHTTKSYSFLGLFDKSLEDYWSQRYLNTVLGLTLGAQNVSNTITAIISLERCICVLSPFTAKKFLRTRYMAVLIAAMSSLCDQFLQSFQHEVCHSVHHRPRHQPDPLGVRAQLLLSQQPRRCRRAEQLLAGTHHPVLLSGRCHGHHVHHGPQATLYCGLAQETANVKTTSRRERKESAVTKTLLVVCFVYLTVSRCRFFRSSYEH